MSGGGRCFFTLLTDSLQLTQRKHGRSLPEKMTGSRKEEADKSGGIPSNEAQGGIGLPGQEIITNSMGALKMSFLNDFSVIVLDVIVPDQTAVGHFEPL